MRTHIRNPKQATTTANEPLRFIVMIMALITFVVLAIPAWGFLLALHQNPPSTKNLKQLAPEKRAILKTEEIGGQPGGYIPYPLRVDLTINQLDPADDTVEMFVALHMDEGGEEEFDKVYEGHDQVFHGQALTDKFKNTKLQGELSMETPFGPTVTVPVPLRRFSNFSRLVRLPLQGKPNRYPQDWYEGDALVYVVLPNDLHYVGGAGPIESSFMPAKLALGAGSDTGLAIDYQLATKDDRSEAEFRFAPVQRFRILMRRDGLTQAFVWTMGIIPLLLLLMALVQASQSWRGKSIAVGAGTALSLEAVALLAILPLRQVLVPPEVRGLTTVDFLLGAELAAFIVLIVVQYERSLRTRTHPKAQGPAEVS
jgi:hypothetical protein